MSSEYKRVLCLDVGNRYIGVAVSDALGITAQGLETIRRTSLDADLAEITRLLEYYSTDRLLLGMPRRMDGSIGEQGVITGEFADKLREHGWQVCFFDERMTTAMARQALIQGEVRREKRKQYIDKLAAVLILQGFMDSGGWIEPRQNYKYTGKEVFHLMDDNNSMELDNIVELEDEDGNSVRFEHLMTLEHAGERYVLLVPAEDIEGVAEDEVVILRLDTDSEGEDVYVTVDDETVLEAVFNKYLEIVEAEDE